jgi:hypothetical protein
MAKTHPYISVAPRLSLFDELVAIRLTLCMFMAISISHILIFVELFLRNHSVAVANSVRWTGSNTAVSCPCIFGCTWLCGCSYEIYVLLLCGCRGKAAKILAHLPDARAGPEFKSRRKNNN